MIKYIGKKHLNSNFYEKIALIRKSSDEVIVRVKVDERFKKLKTEKTSTPYITDTISKLSDTEKLVELVAYFLRNNTICELNQEKEELVIKATSGRQLTLKIEGNKKIQQMIIEKYNMDRLKFISSTDISTINIVGTHLDKYYHICSKTSSYGVSEDFDEKKEVFITYSSNNGVICSFDQKFIDDYVKAVIDNSVSLFYPFEKGRKYIVWADGKEIKLPLEFRYKYKHLIFNRIHEINESKKKQLKLEGLK